MDLTTRKMHKVLEQQLSQWLGDTSRPLPAGLIEAIDQAYQQADAVEAELKAEIQAARELQAVGRIAGGIAHDFNNLLTVIKGYCDLGLRLSAQDDGPVTKALEQISEATGRAAEMTVQLLALSRRRKPDPVHLDLGRVLNELQPMLRRLAEGGNQLILEISDSPSPILADRGRLQQLLLNLVICAFEALSAPGSVTLRAIRWAEASHLHKALADSQISRNGVLLLAEISASEARSKPTVGLSALHNLVKEMGGEVTVGDGPPQAWVVSLPLHQPAAVDLPQISTQVPLSSARILVVEDEEPVRMMLEALLTDQGHRVTLAPGPEDALAYFKAHSDQIDLLVTDIVMPGMHGPQMAQMMKGDRPDLAVLFISGYDPDARERRGAPAPGGAFLQKPFDAATLNLKIREVLSSS